MTTIDIEKLAIETDADRPDVAYVVDDFLRNTENNLGGGVDYGAVVVRIGVDGEFDRVQADLGQSGDLECLDRAICALEAVRDELTALYDARPRRRVGRCLASGDWGRCVEYGQSHEGEDHTFPEEPMNVTTFARAISAANAS